MSTCQDFGSSWKWQSTWQMLLFIVCPFSMKRIHALLLPKVALVIQLGNFIPESSLFETRKNSLGSKSHVIPSWLENPISDPAAFGFETFCTIKITRCFDILSRQKLWTCPETISYLKPNLFTSLSLIFFSPSYKNYFVIKRYISIDQVNVYLSFIFNIRCIKIICQETWMRRDKKQAKAYK